MIIIVRMISHQVVDAQGSPLCIGGQPSQFESLLVTTVILHPSSQILYLSLTLLVSHVGRRTLRQHWW